ncbi:hypothetical protein HGO38_14570 [Rhizobium sp. CG5]|nr:hypothetical protein [Rhizobium sp. CG5]
MVLFWFYFLLVGVACGATGAVAAQSCRDVDFRDAHYTVCQFDPAHDTMRIYDRGPDGQPFGGFDSLSRQIWAERHTLVFASNGGMYHDDLSPVGLFVEHGIERQPISTSGGWGNFHLLPNGVFFLKDGRAGVLETQAYLKAKVAPDFATQSGPMLVIDGKVHPRFLPDSDSLKRRNAVGVDAEGQVFFAISQDAVRFYDFALLFRDALHCANALYLDGTISSVMIAERNRRDNAFRLGPMIAVIGNRPD